MIRYAMIASCIIVHAIPIDPHGTNPPSLEAKDDDTMTAVADLKAVIKMELELRTKDLEVKKLELRAKELELQERHESTELQGRRGFEETGHRTARVPPDVDGADQKTVSAYGVSCVHLQGKAYEDCRHGRQATTENLHRQDPSVKAEALPALLLAAGKAALTKGAAGGLAKGMAKGGMSPSLVRQNGVRQLPDFATEGGGSWSRLKTKVKSLNSFKDTQEKVSRLKDKMNPEATAAAEEKKGEEQAAKELDLVEINPASKYAPHPRRCQLETLHC